MKKYMVMFLMMANFSCSAAQEQASQLFIANSVIDKIAGYYKQPTLFTFKNDNQKVVAAFNDAINVIQDNKAFISGTVSLSELPKTLEEFLVQIPCAPENKQGLESFAKKTMVLLHDIQHPSYFNCTQSYAVVTACAVIALLCSYKLVLALAQENISRDKQDVSSADEA